jgi:tetratricopeptide (TPR) repeat protein
MVIEIEFFEECLHLFRAVQPECDEHHVLVLEIRDQAVQLRNLSAAWRAAERYYQRALEIKIEFSDRYSQGRTYHSLGIVAQAQRQWAAAERYYQFVE